MQLDRDPLKTKLNVAHCYVAQNHEVSVICLAIRGGLTHQQVEAQRRIGHRNQSRVSGQELRLTE